MLARIATLLALTATPLAAQAPRLGTISFPATGADAAQADFLRGVLYLHSFEYNSAAQAFRRARELDPAFVMAYWGEAMTHNHPLWDQQDAAAARAILAALAPTTEARLARARTPRERAWLAAAEALYGEGSKQRRDTLHYQAMERVLAEHPDDEARTFTALALMGLSQATRNVPAYMRAGALADEVLRSNPDHPGAAHYVIHAFDDPIHAPLGLRAARAYSRIAPDAAHAQHMTTHIFVALGMWDEVVAQNEVAVRATARVPGHYSYWLVYGELQRGRVAEARAQIALAAANMNPQNRNHAAHLSAMRAQYLLTTNEWTGAIAQSAWPAQDWAYAPLAAYTRGVRAAHARDADGVAAALREVGEWRASGPTEALKQRILGTHLRAFLSLAAGDRPGAITLLRQAAAAEDSLPMEYGPPDIAQPSWELLGAWLLETGDAAGAQRAYTRALELAPGRSSALVGLVRAATRAGDAAAARRAYDQLAANLRGADSDVRWLADLERRGN